jgi:DsbC/DsbD-like thiol-disulfide interchange protein
VSTIRFLLFSVCLGAAAFAQQNAVRFTLEPEQPKAAPGKALRLKIAAEIDPGWHLYSVTSPVKATATRVTAPEDSPVTVTRVWQQKAEAKFDPAAGATTESYETKALFYVDAALKGDAKPGPAEVSLQVRWSACNDKICLPPRRKLVTAQVTVDPAAPEAAALVPEGFVEANPATAATPRPPRAARRPLRPPRRRRGCWASCWERSGGDWPPSLRPASSR